MCFLHRCTRKWARMRTSPRKVSWLCCFWLTIFILIFVSFLKMLLAGTEGKGDTWRIAARTVPRRRLHKTCFVMSHACQFLLLSDVYLLFSTRLVCDDAVHGLCIKSTQKAIQQQSSKQLHRACEVLPGCYLWQQLYNKCTSACATKLGKRYITKSMHYIISASVVPCNAHEKAHAGAHAAVH